jgi:hypothetical protein
MNPSSELPSTPMSALRLMPNKAKEVATFAHGIIKAVQNGDANPLEVLAMLRSLELLSEEVREEIQDNILTAAEKYSEKKFEAFGAIMERCEVYTKYDYTTSKDVEWERLDAEIKALEARKKERENFLRSLKEPLTYLDKESGALEEIRPPFKRSKTGVKVFLK